MDRIGDGEVAARLISPGFQLAPPDIRHAELIPDAIAEPMAWAWRQIWFPARDVRVCALENVVVAAEGLVLRAGGDVVRETVQQHSPVQVAAAQSATQSAVQAAPPMARLDGTSILCRKPGAWNYGHWLVEMLPRAAMAGEAARVLVQDVAPPLMDVMRDGLALLGFDETRIAIAGAEPVSVERLLVVDGLSEHGCYLSPLALGVLERVTAHIAPAGPTWLFVTRTGGRRLVDEDAIAAAARIAGYTVVDPATLNFKAQVALFKGARRVAGVMGAGMANIVFAPGDAEIFLFAPASMPDNFFWFLAGLRGQRCLEIRCAAVAPPTGPEPWDAALWLTTADLERMLDPAPLPARPPWAGLEAALLRQFDVSFYHTTNPDVAASGIDPLRHYLEIGWREGRNPSAAFNTRQYLAEHDVAGINPLIHAILNGGPHLAEAAHGN